MSEKQPITKEGSNESRVAEAQETREVVLDKREELIGLLSEKGLEDSEARRAFDEWVGEKELLAEKEGPVARIGMEVEIAEVSFYGYCDADDVLDMLYNTLEMAKGEELPELEEKVRKIIRRIEGYEGEDSIAARRLISFKL